MTGRRSDPLSQFSRRATPQTQRADARQSHNPAGGYSFTVDDVSRLRRFLILGVDGGTYYTSERNLTIDVANVVVRLATSSDESHRELVNTIVDVSTRGAAPRQQPALFALAIASSLGEPASRRYALYRLSDVARTGTALLTFVRYVEQFRGWGRQLRRGIAEWYLRDDVRQVAYQVAKYYQRDGWSHRDVLRLAHPKPADGDFGDHVRKTLFDWVCHRADTEALANDDVLSFVEGRERVQSASTARKAAKVIREHRLTHDVIPTCHLSEPVVWEALLDVGIPQTALLRQLPRLTRLGILRSHGRYVNDVCAQLRDVDRIRRARVHPLSLLIALRTYASGQSFRGSATWTPIQKVVDALDAAFYAAFDAIEPTGQRLLVAVDTSSSMTIDLVLDAPITPREAATALALTTLATEPNADVVGFTTSMYELPISARQRLDDAVRVVSQMRNGGTDCASPIDQALREQRKVDAFVMYTDSVTWYGRSHPHQMLLRYRERTGIPAKLVVVGMTGQEFTIADPSDAGSLDVVGLDTATPRVIADFIRTGF